MAYPYYPYQPNYFSTPYQSQTQQPQMVAQQAQTSANNGIIWVQGESGAKSYLIAPNTTVMLMDSESNKFYLKSADASGIPLPLRKFTYSEDAPEAQNSVISVNGNNSPTYDAKGEIEALKSELEALKEKFAESEKKDNEKRQFDF